MPGAIVERLERKCGHLLEDRDTKRNPKILFSVDADTMEPWHIVEGVESTKPSESIWYCCTDRTYSDEEVSGYTHFCISMKYIQQLWTDISIKTDVRA